jgi:hypothetical protein
MMLDLGPLKTQDGWLYQALLPSVDAPEITLAPVAGACTPILLAVEDLVREREPWEGCGLRVRDEGMVFAAFVLDPELETLRQSYRGRHSRLRLRVSGLSS